MNLRIVCLLCLQPVALFQAQVLPFPRSRAPRVQLASLEGPASPAQLEQPPAPLAPSLLSVIVNKTIVLENAIGIRRISITNLDIAEAVAASATEVLINGKGVGDTTLILWDKNGQRTMFDVHVAPNEGKLDAVRQQIADELPGQNISVTLEAGNLLLKGLAKDMISADRAVSIASALGRVINLLHVCVPPGDPQVLLKVRFANIDRTALSQLGANFFSTPNSVMPGSLSTGQFGGPPAFNYSQNPATMSIPDALNLFIFRKDLNFGTYIKALQDQQLVQILAEPNLLTLSGHEASFLAGGEFPFPMLQGGGAGVGQITIEFREFGIRLRFKPTVTPRGTIHLLVNPEVSALDPANGLTVQGYTIPGLSTRRVQTEVELQNGQSFVIAGLLDNRLTETINKIPGLANIPLLGKLFESRELSRNNTELLVLVTPEIVEPIPTGKAPSLDMPKKFMDGVLVTPPQNPAAPPGSTLRIVSELPVELMKAEQDDAAAANSNSTSKSAAAPAITNMQPTPLAHN